MIGCDELELGLARVECGLAELEEDPMNLALCRLDDSLKVLHMGYLWKLSRSTASSGSGGGLITSKWSKRWFILRGDACLYFFKRESVRATCCVLLPLIS